MSIVWTQQDLDSLGKMTDQSLANRMSRTQKIKISSDTVRAKRLELKIDAFVKKTVKPKPWTAEQVALFGKLPDKKIAAMTGRPVEAVAQARVYRKIPVCPAENKKGRPPIEWTAEDLADLGKVKDGVIAKRKNIPRQQVSAKRNSMGIAPAPTGEEGSYRGFSAVEVELFGTMYDQELAEKIGKPADKIKKARISMGVAAFTYPNRQLYALPAHSQLPLSWADLAEVDQHEFFRILTRVFFEKTGRELTFNLLARLSLWPVPQLKLWFVPQDTKTGLPLTTRHHLWLAVLMGL